MWWPGDTRNPTTSPCFLSKPFHSLDRPGSKLKQPHAKNLIDCNTMTPEALFFLHVALLPTVLPVAQIERVISWGSTWINNCNQWGCKKRDLFWNHEALEASLSKYSVVCSQMIGRSTTKRYPVIAKQPSGNNSVLPMFHYYFERHVTSRSH